MELDNRLTLKQDQHERALEQKRGEREEMKQKRFDGIFVKIGESEFADTKGNLRKYKLDRDRVHSEYESKLEETQK